MGSVRIIVLLDCGGGSKSLRLTSCGNVRGAEPIRDLHFLEVEKGRDINAGIKKSGSDVETN